MEQASKILQHYLKVISSCKTEEQLVSVMGWCNTTLDYNIDSSYHSTYRAFVQGATSGAINCKIKQFKYKEKWGL